MLLSSGVVSVPSLPNVQVLILLDTRLTLTGAAVSSKFGLVAVTIVRSLSCQAIVPAVAINVLVNLPGIRLGDNVQPSAEKGVASVSNCARKP